MAKLVNMAEVHDAISVSMSNNPGADRSILNGFDMASGIENVESNLAIAGDRLQLTQ